MKPEEESVMIMMMIQFRVVRVGKSRNENSKCS